MPGARKKFILRREKDLIMLGNCLTQVELGKIGCSVIGHRLAEACDILSQLHILYDASDGEESDDEEDYEPSSQRRRVTEVEYGAMSPDSQRDRRKWLKRARSAAADRVASRLPVAPCPRALRHAATRQQQPRAASRTLTPPCARALRAQG